MFKIFSLIISTILILNNESDLSRTSEAINYLFRLVLFIKTFLF